MDHQDEHSKNDSPTKAIYRSKTIPMKIPTQFFTVLEGTILNFIWKKLQRAKTILYNEGTPGSISTPDLKLYHTAVGEKLHGLA